jgi:hypothetical protein
MLSKAFWIYMKREEFQPEVEDIQMGRSLNV